MIAPRESEKARDGMTEDILAELPDALPPPRKSFVQTLSLWDRVDHDVSFFMTMAGSFTYFLVPQASWVTAILGIKHWLIGARLFLHFAHLGGMCTPFLFPL